MSGETIGQLYERLGPGGSAYFPEYGMVIRRPYPPTNDCCSCPDSIVCVQEVNDGCVAGCECGCTP